MIAGGFKKREEYLMQEIDQLKECLIMLQNELKDMLDVQVKKIMNSSVAPILLKEAKILAQKASLRGKVAFIWLSMPTNQNIQQIQNSFQMNLESFRDFYNSLINPVTVASLLDEVNKANSMKQEVPKLLTIK